jgi:8-oxo-dGTP pyrophosphatase MutT (NUDIX family)
MKQKQGFIAVPEIGRQVAALPFRVSSAHELEILIITSRATARFIIPKGWPMKRLRDPDAAAREAYEEAGVMGQVQRQPIGTYPAWKRHKQAFEFVEVDVFPLQVLDQYEDWPEKGRRQMAWLSPEDAALLIDEPGLAGLIRDFAMTFTTDLNRRQAA